LSVLAVTEVRLDASRQRVIKAKMGPVIKKGNEWMAAPKLVNVSEVVNAIKSGDDVFTIFTVGGNLVPGPRLSVMTYPEGGEGIYIDGPETPLMTLRDLPAF